MFARATAKHGPLSQCSHKMFAHATVRHCPLSKCSLQMCARATANTALSLHVHSNCVFAVSVRVWDGAGNADQDRDGNDKADQTKTDTG